MSPDDPAAAIRRRKLVRYVALVALILLSGGGVGFVTGAAMPEHWFPPRGFGLFWHDFLTGPPAAGLMAIVAAWIAWLAARHTAKVARSAAERELWWKRAEWALDLARSDNESDRLVGLRTLAVLSPTGTRDEKRLVAEAARAISGDVPVVASPGGSRGDE